MNQYFWTSLSSSLNFAGLSFHCIALQNDNPAFLTILGYATLIYAFFADTFIFEDKIQGVLQLTGVGMILIMNLLLVCSKLKENSKDPKTT